jgi:putative endonuclease
MKHYFVYMLECVDGSFYVGITNNVEKRLWQHENGWDERAYTHTRRPVRLVHASTFRDVRAALDWEKQLKGWSRAKKRALIGEDWNEIKRRAKRHGGFLNDPSR